MMDNKYREFIFLLIFMSTTALINAQHLINTTNQITEVIGETSGGSTSLDHITMFALKFNIEEINCGYGFSGQTELLFIIAQQADLIYFETYYDTTKTQINTQGYYRLIFIDTEIGYCWKQDLIWNTFNPNGYLIKKQYYNAGMLTETPKMPQPNAH